MNSTIQATKFTPSGTTVQRHRPSGWRILLFALAALVVFILWFLFTSKSVQIDFTPAASDVEVRGGFSFELGGVYLLREGSYQVMANAELHTTLDAQIQVGGARNQKIELVFTPLPGQLHVSMTPHDAVLSVDGIVVPASPVELAAGQHEISVTHPRYLPNNQIIDMQGKRIEQQVDVNLEPNWADVTIASSPPGARILIDDVDSGRVTPNNVEALAGERDIRIAMEGFKSHRERIFAQAGISMELEPIRLVQADAQLTVTSSPKGAGVTVNGRFAGKTPLQLDLKSQVGHKIQVISSGYKTYIHTAKLAQGENTSMHAPLALQTGEVVVQVRPPGAQIKVDGKSIGQGDQTVRLPVRSHRVEVSLDGYAGYAQSITPKAGLTQQIKVQLLTIADARLKALKPTQVTSAGQNLKLFDPYAFMMGASRREPGRRANETLRKVDLTRLFYLSTQEVSNAQFRKFATGHDSGRVDDANLNDDEQPAANVSWHDAAAYCNWLSEQDGLPPFYQVEFAKVIGFNRQATGYRLPIEAEWAWAARTLGDPSKDDGSTGEQLRFPWGSNLPPPERQGNYADRAASNLVGRIIFGYNDNHRVSAPIGTFKADARGLFDLGGNVAEWTNDFYAIPEAQDSTDPFGPDSGDYHVIRGSSWQHGTITELRYSFRDYGTDGRDDVGFRIARYAE